MNKQTKDFDSRGTLHAKTHELLIQDERSLSRISTDYGIPFYWLQRFQQNVFKNPSVNRVQYLYECLTKKPIQL